MGVFLEDQARHCICTNASCTCLRHSTVITLVEGEGTVCVLKITEKNVHGFGLYFQDQLTVSSFEIDYRRDTF